AVAVARVEVGDAGSGVVDEAVEADREVAIGADEASVLEVRDPQAEGVVVQDVLPDGNVRVRPAEGNARGGAVRAGRVALARAAVDADGVNARGRGADVVMDVVVGDGQIRVGVGGRRGEDDRVVQGVILELITVDGQVQGALGIDPRPGRGGSGHV